MASLTTVFLVIVITVASGRNIPVTNEPVTQEYQSTDAYTTDHEITTIREDILQGDLAGLRTNERSETRKSSRNIDTRAYDNLNINSADKNPNIQGDQYIRSSSNKNRFNSWNKGVSNESKDRRTMQNKKQTTEKVRTDNRLSDKTTRDNEVTPKTDKVKKPKDQEEDRWIWPDEKVETTTMTSKGVTFEDRASFTGDNCPTGQVKFNNVCVDID